MVATNNNIFDTSNLENEKVQGVLPELRVFYEPKIVDKTTKFSHTPKNLYIREEGVFDEDEDVEKYALGEQLGSLQTL